MGRHRVARLMRENALKARQRRRFKRTTDSLHAFPVAPNLLNQRLQRSGAEEPEMGCRHLLCLDTRGTGSTLPSSLTSLLGASSAGPPATGSIRNWRFWPYAGPSPCGVQSVGLIHHAGPWQPILLHRVPG